MQRILPMLIAMLLFCLPLQPARAATEKATFAGGCFWCMEAPFDKLPGVLSVTPGYAGGRTKNPTYEQVSAGGTGHAESVQIVFDPSKISYSRLLDSKHPPAEPGAFKIVNRSKRCVQKII